MPADFAQALNLPSGLPSQAETSSSVVADSSSSPLETEDLTLKSWPTFSMKACPGLLGEFVGLATRNSEADPAAVCITALVRFCAEIYGLAPQKGPHIYVGETVHPPRLFAVICGNSSKARKGTSRHPVTKLFGREYCYRAQLDEWRLPMPARESGGPLSTGEGLAYFVRDESDEERERRQKNNPNEILRDKDDKRLIILDEEFASGLSCTKREGNTLSMGIRCFWDSGEYAPLTKNNPISVRGAHINILTHITMQELSVCLGDVQAFNGFANRFLWICARRAKLVIEPLLRMGLIKGGDLQNALVIYETPMSQEGLDYMTDKLGQPRLDATKLGYLSPLNYPNEPARHKLLDLIGDMALCGCRIQGKIIALRPGHTFNTQCCKQLRNKLLASI